MRNKDGGIDTDQYTVGIDKDIEPFSSFWGGPAQQEIDRWSAYPSHVLGPNPVRKDSRLQYDDDGLPKLPKYQDTWSTADAASAMDAWFHAMWQFCRKDTDLPNGLDWDIIKTNLDDFVPARWLDVGINRPTDLPFYMLASLYHRLFESQSGSNAFRWIHRQVSNASQSTTHESSEPITAAARPPPETLPLPPSTPARQRRVVYSTPSKTPSRRPQAAGTPSHRLPTLAEGDEVPAESSTTTYALSSPPGNHHEHALLSSGESVLDDPPLD
ncbi:hypothetical protein K466DRAFT_607924, partial [Polyporus arcularius HHB13444]